MAEGAILKPFLAESIEPYKDFVESENLFSAFYVNELINFLLPYSDESTELFKIYQDCIQNLKAEEKYRGSFKDL